MGYDTINKSTINKVTLTNQLDDLVTGVNERIDNLDEKVIKKLRGHSNDLKSIRRKCGQNHESIKANEDLVFRRTGDILHTLNNMEVKAEERELKLLESLKEQKYELLRLMVINAILCVIIIALILMHYL